MNIIADDAGRALNEDEKTQLKQAWPAVDPNSIKYLGKGFTEVEDFSDQLCEPYHCLTFFETQVRFTANNSESSELSYLVNSGAISTEEICLGSEYECYEAQEDLATYNCIGWALGVSKWLSTTGTNEYIENGLSHKQAIMNFLADSQLKYPETHLSNFGKLLGKLELIEQLDNPPANNTIAFYFKGDDLTHASRYISTINGLLRLVTVN